MAEERIDPLSQALAETMTNVSRFSTNSDIASAAYGLLVAANELLCLRHDETLTENDRKYLVSAMGWSDKARTIISDLLIDLAKKQLQ